MAPAPTWRWHPGLWLAAVGLWLCPAAAQLLLAGMDWDRQDFLAFALMLAVAAGAMELALRLLPGRRPRWQAGGTILAGFLLVWAELAVGILGPG